MKRPWCGRIGMTDGLRVYSGLFVVAVPGAVFCC
jgi:hypothetical protein